MIPFSLIIGIGASIGLLRVIQNTPADSRFRWLGAALIGLTGGVIGARIGFVTAYAAYFTNHSDEIFQITKGGLSWPGALTGACLFAWLGLVICKLPRLSGFDRLNRMLLPFGLAIWLAGWQAGIAYGQLLPGGTWWGMFITDDTGMTALRVPLQAAAILSLTLLMIISETLVKNFKRPGLQAGILASVFTLHSLLFSLMRVDAVQRFLDLRLDTWAAAFLFLSSLVILIIAISRKDRIITPEINEMEK